MNDRFDTRRAGRERDRYEADRGNARSDRERYELRDRDESGYRGWGGEERDSDRSRYAERDDRDREERWSTRGQDDRDRWRMMDESERSGRRGQMDREPMRQGRAGYGVSSSNREEFSRDDFRRGEMRGGNEGQSWNERQQYRPSEDFRGQGYGGQYGGGQRGVSAEMGGREDWSHRGYGGSMSGDYTQGGQYGQQQYGQQQYGQAQYGHQPYGQGQYGQGAQGRTQGFGQQHSGQFQGQAYGQYGQGSMSQGWGGGMQQRRNKGPKGYKRSDERIREDVCDQLGHADDIDCSDVEVTVSNGEVTLAGTVNERRMKYVAEQVAERISGVNEIHNQLRVKREEQSQTFGRDQQQTQHTGQQTNVNAASTGLENGRRGASR